MRERLGLLFWGAGLIAAGFYLRGNFGTVQALRSLSDLMLLAGTGVFLYALALAVLLPARHFE